MNIGILLNASHPIPLHSFFAIAAIIFGAIQFASKKGTLTHRTFGYLWITSMVVVCLSSFFIKTLQFDLLFGFSPIHFLSIWTLISLYLMIYHARKKQIPQHKTWSRNTYFLSLVIAGFFTFYPGRIMYKVFVGT
ncbi:DUF2306 domain-containing protein [Pseudoalteromonas phenolica]|uniref:Putative membrane protein (DUF2306) n=1 Tax=Pseudoalteromonas phenolica TaxID=161398 RepID=A0A0S2K6V2_9GAMM|nr:DUF2306 domain-containing protein [Pseudoalteromonas phenolica]ALO43822.1 Putative membrane protein (DUF2306) [Pseudoalteromonas phenolica]MBE0355000.1 hypothetical protein [Pseudoalteromonas phenolica O-BC30]RXE95552.1 DUF2306 domain-containing protein [Pseudoalteromonas phenolica O-BC30]|tara:strand:- start:227 stop:631 length:405 start_codon:yes stop_codon:yes gene_type:complete